MCNDNESMMGKKEWSKMVWDEAWKIDDAYRQSTAMLTH